MYDFYNIIIHNVVDRVVLQAMWEELADKVGHRDQLIICQTYLSENAIYNLNRGATSMIKSSPIYSRASH